MTPHVFLPEDIKRFDLSSIEKYGKTVFLSDKPLDPFHPNQVHDILSSELLFHHYNPTKDYLCMTGNSLILSLFLATVFDKFDSVKMLMFNARTSSYCERVLTKGESNARTPSVSTAFP